MAYTLYANKLYSDENTPVANAVASATVNLVNPNETVEAEKAIMNVQSPTNGRLNSPTSTHSLQN